MEGVELNGMTLERLKWKVGVEYLISRKSVDEFLTAENLKQKLLIDCSLHRTNSFEWEIGVE
jgi:hypothetical protein